MDVLTLLKEDHRNVGALLDEANGCEPDDKRIDSLALQIEKALTVHAAIEEKCFYPALHERAEQTDDTVDVFEAYTEHDLIKMLIALLKSGRQPDEQFKAELQVLSENVKHHVKEEESTIFSLARHVLDREELEELGKEMAAAKERLLRGTRERSVRKAPSAKKRTNSTKRTTSTKSANGKKQRS